MYRVYTTVHVSSMIPQQPLLEKFKFETNVYNITSLTNKSMSICTVKGYAKAC